MALSPLLSTASAVLLLCQKTGAFQTQFTLIQPKLKLVSTQDNIHTNDHNNEHVHRRSIRTTSSLQEKYGRGAEIYPPTNAAQFSLSDSFPNGIVPPSAQSILDGNSVDDDAQEDQISTDANGVGRKRKVMKKAIKRILKSAAKSEIELASESLDSTEGNGKSKTSGIGRKIEGKIPGVIALALLCFGLIPPTSILFVTFMSGYLIVLAFMASSPKSFRDVGASGGNAVGTDSGLVSLSTPPITLPNLPPQGHVPSLFTNPLGHLMTNSQPYNLWLRLGLVLGYILPCLATGVNKYTNNIENARKIAVPVFLTSCQLITESISKKMLSPLPIRILIPLTYNAIRMGPLYYWLMSWPAMSRLGRLLALGNFLYWGANLFGFLIPIATMRYMRCHFFCVEAEEVIMRPGDEEKVGLLGSYV